MGCPQVGFVDPIMNAGPGFHSNIPINELTERVTRAIEASDVSSTPLVVETMDGAMITKMSRPSAGPLLHVGARGKLDSQGDRTRGRSTTTDQSDPRGPESRKIFPTSRILRLHAPKRADRDKREPLSYQDMTWATKRRPTTSEFTCPKKPLEE